MSLRLRLHHSRRLSKLLRQAAVLPGSTEKMTVAEVQKALPKDVVILRGSALGAVKFEHKLHSSANYQVRNLPPPIEAGKACHSSATGLLELPHQGGDISHENQAPGRVS